MTANKLATMNKGKNYKEYKIIRYKNTVFLTPPSSEQALNPPPLKRGGVLLVLQSPQATEQKGGCADAQPPN